MDDATLPTGKTDLRDWLNLANEWAETVYLANSLPAETYAELQEALADARHSLDAHFYAFLQARYSAVGYYEDNRGPMSLQAVNSWLHYHLNPDERLAVLCFDGLALDQWFLLRSYLSSVAPDLEFRENRTYAIAPTVTPIARQALFSGRRPAEFAETANRTDKDATRWEAYWVNRNVPKRRVSYLHIKAGGQGMSTLGKIVDGKNQRLGIVVNLFDEVMHGIKDVPPGADKRVYYGTLRSYLEHSSIGELMQVLLDNGYRVYLTADHGNIAGTGNGLKPPRALIEGYARRVVLFDEEKLAEEYAAKHGLRAFRTKALPPGMYPVYAPGTQLFDSERATHVSHGGLSVEELVVPFVEIVRGPGGAS
jgi:hypothetical protein